MAGTELSPLPVAGEVMDLGVETTATIFQNQYNSYLHHLSILPQLSVTITLHQNRLILQHMKTVTSIHHWSNA